MIEELKSNLLKEKQLLQEISLFSIHRENAKKAETSFFDKTIKSLVDQLGILNNSIPDILEKIQVREAVAKPAAFEKGRPMRIITNFGALAVSKNERKKFVNELHIEEEALRELKKIVKSESEKMVQQAIVYTKPNPFAIFSSKLFSEISFKLAEQAKSFGLHTSLKKAGMPYLLNTYIAMTIAGTLISLVTAIIFALIFTLFSPSKDLALSLAKNIAISFAVPVITLILFFVYPSSQASSISGKIDNELPFAIMHMATIAGSGVEPSRIFKIIALSNDYPAISKEAKKIINLINFYGYDLVGALHELAKTTPSERFSDVLNGMATTITSGGDLNSYLKKNAEDTLLDYKLKRKKYVEVSGTYADVYTGLLIAAPLIFMLMLALINMIGITGISTQTLGIIGIAGIAALNIGFLVFLGISQPES